MKPTPTILAALAAAAPALAQSDIAPSGKFSWQPNSGWMNWRDANAAAQGVRDHMTCLSGYIWCENIGWISVGDGTPARDYQYVNTTGADFGVNVSSTGMLSGFGWSPNVGWINFAGGALASPPQPARLDLGRERVYGYAWGENIGWINLDVATAGKFVKRLCYANCDGSTTPPLLDANDVACFNQLFAAGDPRANCDRSTKVPIVNSRDFDCFMQRFAAGCP